MRLRFSLRELVRDWLGVGHLSFKVGVEVGKLESRIEFLERSLSTESASWSVTDINLGNGVVTTSSQSDISELGQKIAPEIVKGYDQS